MIDQGPRRLMPGDRQRRRLVLAAIEKGAGWGYPARGQPTWKGNVNEVNRHRPKICPRGAAAAPLIGINPNGGGLMATDFDGLFRMSRVFAASGLMPKGMERPETVFVALEMGMEVGLQPMQAVQNIAVINGRPSIWGDALLALVAGSGLLDDFQEIRRRRLRQRTISRRFAWPAARAGPPPIRSEFSIADAKLAGLWTKAGPWTQYPRRMLKMRARSWALRDGFPDVLKGMKSAEEIMDMEPPGHADRSGQFRTELQARAGSVLWRSIGCHARRRFQRHSWKHQDLRGRLRQSQRQLRTGQSDSGRSGKPENTMAFYTAFGDWVMKQALEKPAEPKEAAPDQPEAKTKGRKSAPAKKAAEKPKEEPEAETRDMNVPADELQIDSIKNLGGQVEAVR